MGGVDINIAPNHSSFDKQARSADNAYLMKGFKFWKPTVMIKPLFKIRSTK